MILILLYHSVNSKTDYIHSVDPEDFESQMRFINRYFNLVCLEDIDKYLNDEKELGDINMAVTFDDGFRDNYFEAFPILKKYNVPATIFLTIDNINNTINANKERFGGLTRSEIEEMKASKLIDFQPHTYSHPVLPSLKSDKIKEEFKKSNNYFRETLNIEPEYFAYPKAKVDNNSKKIVEKYYEMAFAGNGAVDKWNIPRVSIYRKDKKFRFRIKLIAKILFKNDQIMTR